MKGPPGNLKWERVIVPWALFAGVILSCAACCFYGWKTTQAHPFVHFDRFHQLLSPETHFYPPASQVMLLAQKRTKKERINVVIGGSSILNGARQFPNEVWSDKLAELLGPEYQVVNLACRGASSGEFGAIVAETLLKRRRFILLVDAFPGSGHNPPDGNHRYFFWDAWYKGLIDKKVSSRTTWVERGPAHPEFDPKYYELRSGAWLNSKMYFNDFWNTLAYTKGGTLWNPLMQGDSFRPRNSLPDNERGPLPMDARFAAMDHALPPEAFKKHLYHAVFKKGANNLWEVDPEWLESYKLLLKETHPNEKLRQRTMMLVQFGNPHALDQLSPEFQEKWMVQAEATRRVAGELGMQSIIVGTDFTPEDFADHFHLTGSGGAKMAELAAPAIRELAKKLGYENQPKTRPID